MLKEVKIIKIFLDKNIIENSHLSDKAKIVYVVLRKIYKPDLSNYYINIKMLIYNLTCTNQYNRYLNESLISGIEELIQEDIIHLIKKISNTERIVDLSSLYFKNEDTTFVVIDDLNIFKVMNTKYSCTKYNLLLYYIYRISSLSTTDMYNNNFDYQMKKDIGYMPKTYFINNCKLSEATIYTYNKILSEEKLIYIYKPQLYKNVNNEIISFSGVYGEYINKDKIIECGKALQDNFSVDVLQSKTNSNMRTLSNKFRYIRDKGKQYEYNEMKNIYYAMIKYNKEKREQYFSDEMYNKYKKDLIVFKDYDFYNDKENK